MACPLKRNLAALASALLLAAATQAAPTITNDSNRAWRFEFSERKEDLELLRSNPHHAATVFTVTWAGTGKTAQLFRSGEYVGLKLKPKESVTLTAESEHDLAEIFTFRDELGCAGICSVALKGFGTKENPPAGLGPYVNIRLREHLDRAEKFQREGIVLAGRADIHLLAPSYASIFKDKPRLKDAPLSDILEGELEGSPIASEAVPASAAAPPNLPGPGREEGKTATAPG
jgi:hypothetical protein